MMPGIQDALTQTSDPAVRSSAWLGRWFYAEYGDRIVLGQYVGMTKYGGSLLRFRHGHPFRTVHLIPEHRMFNEALDPRWLAKFSRLIDSRKRPNARTELPPPDTTVGKIGRASCRERVYVLV